jgi:hypothetical protein
MLPEIDWNLAWTIACGVVLGGFLLSILSLIILQFAILPATIVGAFLGYFGWMWLIPGFILGGVCYFVATNMLVKEEDDLGMYP